MSDTQVSLVLEGLEKKLKFLSDAYDKSTQQLNQMQTNHIALGGAVQVAKESLEESKELLEEAPAPSIPENLPVEE